MPPTSKHTSCGTRCMIICLPPLTHCIVFNCKEKQDSTCSVFNTRNIRKPTQMWWIGEHFDSVVVVAVVVVVITDIVAMGLGLGLLYSCQQQIKCIVRVMDPQNLYQYLFFYANRLLFINYQISGNFRERKCYLNLLE